MQKEKYAEAKIEFTNALEINPKNINTLIYRSLINEQLEEHQESIDDITQVFQLGYTPPSLYLRRANNYHDLEQDSNALVDINIFLATDSNSLDGLYIRGVVYFALKKYPLSIKDFTNMLNNNLKPRFSTKGLNSIYLTRALTYLEYEKYDKALEDIKIVLKVDSNQFQALEYRATIYLKLEDNQAALKDINRALYIKPDNTSLLLTKSEILFEMKDYLNTCIYYNKAIDLGYKPNSDEFKEIKSTCNK